MDFNTFIANFKAMIDGVKLTTLVLLILANFVLGIAVSIKTGTFNLRDAGTFLYTRVLPYVVGYMGVGLIATFDNTWAWAVTATWGVIDATLAGSILQNLQDLGLPVPSMLAGGKSPKSTSTGTHI
jgi:phage-related holin